MSTTTQSPHIRAMKTPLVHTIAYRPWTRFRDAWMIGRRDADAQLAHEAPTDVQPSASLRELQAALIERCERERMIAIRHAAPLFDERTRLIRTVAVLGVHIVQTELEQNTLLNADSSGASAAKTEAHLDPAQREARRHREAAVRMAPIVARLVRMRQELADAQLRLADLEARLSTLYESLHARVTALARHYERRSSTQIRSYLRRTPGGAEHPLNIRAALQPPEWSANPNPWKAEATDAAVAELAIIKAEAGR